MGYPCQVALNTAIAGVAAKYKRIPFTDDGVRVLCEPVCRHITAATNGGRRIGASKSIQRKNEDNVWNRRQT